MLLAQRGVSGPDVDAYLKSFENTPHPDGALCSTDFPDQVKREHSQPTPPPQSLHATRPLDPLSVLADASTQVQTSSPMPPAPHYSHNTKETKSCCPPPTMSTPSHSSNGNPFGPAASPLQMSCNAAARIIADMQGHVDHRQARAAMGCSPYEQDCVVNNVNLFRILEQ